ncbi:DNA translocase FtsK, partial [Bombilactobacillus bombi]|uniref:DNA translocase FtsK n=1 Tax=Bombilactobacillus bombi TaxID=1303590 RepID=UPI0015E5B6E4
PKHQPAQEPPSKPVAVTHDFTEPAVPDTSEKSMPAGGDDDFQIEGPHPTKPTPVAKPTGATPTVVPADEGDYQLPSVDLLTQMPETDQSAEYHLIDVNRKKLKQTLDSFGVQVEVKKATLGPTVTKYEVQPAVGVKVSKIVNLADDLALALAAKDIRIEAPIPGKPYVGIEVPNQHSSVVSFRDVVEHEPDHAGHILSVPLGKDVYGQIAMCDLTKLPHLLIAGSTGSGKSVAINTIITGILMQARPSEVKLILIDPKMVELSVYNGVPHLLIPVVTEAKRATGALQKAVAEMERRYKLFEQTGHRKIEEYNQAVEANNQNHEQPALEKLPYIVIIVDELSDLMMAAGHDVEVSIVRLAQKARAAGMHLVIATQRPSVDVITGLIKANVPSRMAFAVSSNVDSRTILDAPGAEKLLGRGDMLFEPIGQSKPLRIQGAYISSEDVERVVKFVSEQQSVHYDEKMIPADPNSKEAQNDEPDDEYWQPAIDLVAHEQKASVSMLQRRFQIGYNRAARLVDYMEERGIVGPARGAKPRKVLIKRPGEDEHTDE